MRRNLCIIWFALYPITPDERCILLKWLYRNSYNSVCNQNNQFYQRQMFHLLHNALSLKRRWYNVERCSYREWKNYNVETLNRYENALLRREICQIIELELCYEFWPPLIYLDVIHQSPLLFSFLFNLIGAPRTPFSCLFIHLVLVVVKNIQQFWYLLQIADMALYVFSSVINIEYPMIPFIPIQTFNKETTLRLQWFQFFDYMLNDGTSIMLASDTQVSWYYVKPVQRKMIPRTAHRGFRFIECSGQL